MEDKINEEAAIATFGVLDVGLAAVGIPPVASLFRSIGKVVSSIRDEVLIGNLKAFLSSALNATKEETDTFFLGMGNDKDDFIKKIIVTVERMNDEAKSKMIGSLFANVVRGKLGKDVFVRLCFVIEKVYVDDLSFLKSQYDHTTLQSFSPLNSYPRDQTDQALLANGLLKEEDQTFTFSEMENKRKQVYVASPLGEALIEYGFE